MTQQTLLFLFASYLGAVCMVFWYWEGEEDE